MDFLTYLAVFLVSVLIFYSTGWVVHAAMLRGCGVRQSFQTVFLRFFLGLVLWTLGYSIIKSGGKTFNLSLIPLLLFGWFEARKLNNSSEPVPGYYPGLMPVFGILGASVVYVFYKYQLMFSGGPFPFNQPFGADYVQHSLISQALQLEGIENKFAPESIMDPKFRGLYPYHYFDLWLNALINQLTGALNYLTLEMVTYPLFMLLAYTGVLALWETRFRVHAGVLVLALIMFGFGSIHLDFYNNFPYLSKANYRLNHFGEGVTGMQKLLQYLPFGLAFAMLLIRQHYKLAFLVLICLSMVYFSALVLLGVLGVFVLVNLIKPIWTSRKDAFIIGVYSVIPFIVFVLMYKLCSVDLGETRDAFDLKLTDPGYTRTRINIMGLSTIQTAVMYAPLLLALALMVAGKGWKQLWNKQMSLLLLLAAGVYGFGLISWVVALENADGMQLVGNNMPVANMLLLGVFVLVLHQAFQRERAGWNVWTGLALMVGLTSFVTLQTATGLLAGASGVDPYNAAYKAAISKTSADQHLLIGGYFKGHDEYTHPQYSHAHKVSQSFKLGQYLAFMPQYYAAVHLSTFDAPLTNAVDNPIENLRERNALNANIFNLFVKEQQEKGTFVSVAQSQLDFIKFHDIKFLIASRSAVVPEAILGLADRVITDENTGERFILLK